MATKEELYEIGYICGTEDMPYPVDLTEESPEFQLMYEAELRFEPAPGNMDNPYVLQLYLYYGMENGRWLVLRVNNHPFVQGKLEEVIWQLSTSEAPRNILATGVTTTIYRSSHYKLGTLRKVFTHPELERYLRAYELTQQLEDIS